MCLVCVEHLCSELYEHHDFSYCNVSFMFRRGQLQMSNWW